MVDNGASECSSLESFTDSWIRLDSKNGSSLENSPKFSDEEEMEEVLADAQTKVDRSGKKEKKVVEQKKEKVKAIEDEVAVKEWITKNENTRKKEKSGCSFIGSNTFMISSLIVTHTLALVIGVVIGKRYLSSSRSA